VVAAFFLADGDGDSSAVVVFFLDDVEDPDTSALAADFFFAVVDVAVVDVFSVVEVAFVVVGVVVSLFEAQETKNATLKRTVIIKKTDFFIDMWMRLRTSRVFSLGADDKQLNAFFALSSDPTF
jgi:hypothetical protein